MSRFVELIEGFTSSLELLFGRTRIFADGFIKLTGIKLFQKSNLNIVFVYLRFFDSCWLCYRRTFCMYVVMYEVFWAIYCTVLCFSFHWCFIYKNCLALLFLKSWQVKVIFMFYKSVFEICIYLLIVLSMYFFVKFMISLFFFLITPVYQSKLLSGFFSVVTNSKIPTY